MRPILLPSSGVRGIERGMREQEEVRILANRILDRPSGDPDDDLAMLSRHLLRADETIERYREALEKLARLGNEPHLGNSNGNDIAQRALGINRNLPPA